MSIARQGQRQTPRITRKWRQRFVDTLAEWHGAAARDFPWRHTDNPYEILVAELFLQRTRAEQVVPVYECFLEQFPSANRIPSLPTLSALIKSLGLPSRAARIHGILCRLRDDFEGIVPDNAASLETLLGGSHHYVRDALLLYAFNQPTAPVDRTIARVVSRVFLGEDPKPAKPHADARIRECARQLVPMDRARSYNLALLDFASLVCTPRPKCDSCPMNGFCKAAKRYQRERNRRGPDASTTRQSATGTSDARKSTPDRAVHRPQ